MDSPAYETSTCGETDPPHVRAEDGSVTVLAVNNRSRTGALPLEVAPGALGPTAVVRHSALAADDPDGRNTLDEPERVVPHDVTGTALRDGVLTANPEPLSWKT